MFMVVEAAVIGLVAVLVFALISGSVRYIANNRIAIVEKLWSGKGSVKGALIALEGEAGYQPDVLRGGMHFLFPFQYRLHVQPLVTIPQGRIGYIFARDGKPLGAGQTLASNASGADFQDARAFLQNGGQKGPQRAVLREGTYAINLAHSSSSPGIAPMPCVLIRRKTRCSTRWLPWSKRAADSNLS